MPGTAGDMASMRAWSASEATLATGGTGAAPAGVTVEARPAIAMAAAATETIGGLLVSLAGRVPMRGELIAHPSGLEFEVLDSDPRRVKRVRITGVNKIVQAQDKDAAPLPETSPKA